MRLITILAVLVLNLSSFAQPNTAERENANEMIGAGDYKSAISLLQKYTKKNSYDLVAWYYLGLASEKNGEIESAKDAYSYSVNMGISILEVKVRKAILAPDQLKGFDGMKEYLQSTIGDQIEAGYDSALALKRLDPKKAAKNEQETKEFIFATFSKKTYLYVSPSDRKSNYFQKIQFPGKRAASYPGTLQRLVTAGSVKLTIMFLPKGRIGFIIPHETLDDGHIKQAIEAAKGIEFKAAQFDGREVTVFNQLEYSFSLVCFPAWPI